MFKSVLTHHTKNHHPVRFEPNPCGLLSSPLLQTCVDVSTRFLNKLHRRKKGKNGRRWSSALGHWLVGRAAGKPGLEEDHGGIGKTPELKITSTLIQSHALTDLPCSDWSVTPAKAEHRPAFKPRILNGWFQLYTITLRSKTITSVCWPEIFSTSSSKNYTVRNRGSLQ